MDFFFKVHKVFNLKYNAKLKSFMYFLEYYVYKQSDARRFLPQKYQSLGREMLNLAALEEAREDADKTVDQSASGA